MIVEFDKSFGRSLDKINDKSLLARLQITILELERAMNLSEVKNVKKMAGFRNYYRVRIGDFRLGLEQINTKTVRLILVAHRKDIYKFFP
jgi:mRNA interferase RelE/StbE